MVKRSGSNILERYADFITPLSEMQAKPLISLGPLSVNIAAGNPLGAPMGKIYQLVGKQSSGKSTLSLDIVAQYLRANPDERVLYVDFERSIDPIYAVRCGVDPTRLLRVHADTTEQGMDIIENVILDGVARLAVIDSVAAAKPSSEDGKSYSDSPKMASAAGILSRFCTRITPILDNNDATIIMINQLRKNFSMMSHETEIPWGGMSLQFSVALSIHLTRTGYKGDTQETQAHIKKNKVGAPTKKAEFKISFGSGIDHKQDVFNLARDMGIITGSTWYNYGDLKAQGEEKSIALFPMDEIRARVIESAERESE